MFQELPDYCFARCIDW